MKPGLARLLVTGSLVTSFLNARVHRKFVEKVRSFAIFHLRSKKPQLRAPSGGFYTLLKQFLPVNLGPFLRFNYEELVVLLQRVGGVDRPA